MSAVDTTRAAGLSPWMIRQAAWRSPIADTVEGRDGNLEIVK
jgi:hypothetical protein